jgi:hypothetical protein
MRRFGRSTYTPREYCDYALALDALSSIAPPALPRLSEYVRASRHHITPLLGVPRL